MYSRLLIKSNLNIINCIKTPHRNISMLQIHLSDKIRDIRLRNETQINNQQVRNISMQSFNEWQMRIYTNISDSTLVGYAQETLLAIHNTTGMPWWLTIVFGTVLARSIVTFPLAIYQNKILAKVENISIELKDLAEELKYEAATAKKQFDLTDVQTRNLYKISLKKQWTNLIIRDNCHPLKASLLIWFQIPLWISLSFSLRNLIYFQNYSMSTEGFGWITNLTDVDGLWILPIIFGITNLTIIEIQRHVRVKKPSRLQNGLTYFFRGFSIVMIPIAASVPSCVCLYWFTSSSFGLLQNLILLSPRFRRFVGIPITQTENQKPFSHLKSVLCSKLKLNKK